MGVFTFGSVERGNPGGLDRAHFPLGYRIQADRSGRMIKRDPDERPRTEQIEDARTDRKKVNIC